MKSNIKATGFGSNVAAVEITFAVVCYEHSSSLHVFHGAPAYADWFRSGTPLASGLTRELVRGMIDQICGEVGAYKQFPWYLWNSRDGYRKLVM